MIVVTAVLAFDFLMSSLKLSCWYYRGGVRIGTFDPLLLIAGQSQVPDFWRGFQNRFLVSFPGIPLPLIICYLIGPI